MRLSCRGTIVVDKGRLAGQRVRLAGQEQPRTGSWFARPCNEPVAGQLEGDVAEEETTSATTVWPPPLSPGSVPNQRARRMAPNSFSRRRTRARARSAGSLALAGRKFISGCNEPAKTLRSRSRCAERRRRLTTRDCGRDVSAATSTVARRKWLGDGQGAVQTAPMHSRRELGREIRLVDRDPAVDREAGGESGSGARASTSDEQVVWELLAVRELRRPCRGIDPGDEVLEER